MERNSTMGEEKADRISSALITMICRLTDESGLDPYAQTSAVAQALAIHMKSMEDMSKETSRARRDFKRRMAVEMTCSTIIQIMEAIDEERERIKQ